MCKSAILILSLAVFCSCSRNAASQNKEATPAKGEAQVKNQAENAAAAPDASAVRPVTKDDKPLVTRDGKPVVVRKGVHLYPVKIDEKYGYIDRSGEVVLKAAYSGGSRFSEGRAAVQLQKGGKVGYIDESGQLVIPLQFDFAEPFSEGLAAVYKDHVWGYVDKSGEIKISPQFSLADAFSEGLAYVGNSGMFTYINPKGEKAIDQKYILAMPFGEGVAAVRHQGEMIRFIDQSGKTVIQPQFMLAGVFVGGLAPVEMRVPEGMRWGFIGKDGALGIPARYFGAYPFSEGFAAVQINNKKWGYITSDGNMAIPAKWDKAEAFANGVAQVWIGDTFGYIDTKGAYIWEPK